MPSACLPLVVTRQASVGVPSTASTTSSGACFLSASRPVIALVTASRVSAAFVAAVLVRVGFTERSSTSASPWETEVRVPALVWWATRSPPTTSRPL